MRKALLLILALALAVTTVMALAEGTPETGEPTPPAVTEEATPETSETPEAPEGTETTEEPEETEPVEPEETATAEPEDTATTEPEETATTEPTADATEEPTEAPTEEPTAEPTAEPTEAPTEEPALSIPTIDPNAVLVGDQPMGDPSVSLTALANNKDYLITIPTTIVLSEATGTGAFPVQIEMGEHVSEIELSVDSNNAWKLKNDEGNELSYTLTHFGILSGGGKTARTWIDTNNFEPGTRRKTVDCDAKLSVTSDTSFDGTFTDTLSFSVTNVTISGMDPGYPEEPGIETADFETQTGGATEQ